MRDLTGFFSEVVFTMSLTWLYLLLFFGNFGNHSACCSITSVGFLHNASVCDLFTMLSSLFIPCPNV